MNLFYSPVHLAYGFTNKYGRFVRFIDDECRYPGPENEQETTEGQAQESEAPREDGQEG